jgi:orotidine-5'-phosphate decarboxylase
MGRIIQRDRSVVPACDVPIEVFKQIVEQTADVDGVGGYKIGPALTGRPGYDAVVAVARAQSNKPLIFDNQKWGTDIPDTAPKLLGPLKEAGIDAVILFPFSGPVTQYEWTKTAQELGLGILVGGEMTHPRAVKGDFSEGKEKNYTEIFEKLDLDPTKYDGYLADTSPDLIFEMAARMGVTNFVVPGNKPDRISHYRSLIEACGVEGAAFWSPGLVAQGGEISEGARAAGRRFNAIVGRGTYWDKKEKRFKTPEEMREAAIELTSKL